MTVHVCPSTIDALEARVERANGAVFIRNSTVRDLEGKDRLRMERLRRVFIMLRERGLDCYPQVPFMANEWWNFLVYRRELLTVDLHVLAADPEARAAVTCALDALSKSYWDATAPRSYDLYKAIRKLSLLRSSTDRKTRHLSVA